MLLLTCYLHHAAITCNYLLVSSRLAIWILLDILATFCFVSSQSLQFTTYCSLRSGTPGIAVAVHLIIPSIAVTYALALLNT
jgi:hypothetical protein